MAKKAVLPSPGSNANEQGAESPWSSPPSSPADYPAAVRADRDPRDNSAEHGLDLPEPYPGSDPPDKPWKSVPSPSPRRIRRDA